MTLAYLSMSSARVCSSIYFLNDLFRHVLSLHQKSSLAEKQNDSFSTYIISGNIKLSFSHTHKHDLFRRRIWSIIKARSRFPKESIHRLQALRIEEPIPKLCHFLFTFTPKQYVKIICHKLSIITLHYLLNSYFTVYLCYVVYELLVVFTLELVKVRNRLFGSTPNSLIQTISCDFKQQH